MEPRVVKNLLRLEQFEADMRSAVRSKLQPADRLALDALGPEKV
jgi:hypothetical protein